MMGTALKRCMAAARKLSLHNHCLQLLLLLLLFRLFLLLLLLLLPLLLQLLLACWRGLSAVGPCL
jgi:hypothetical protein